MAGAILGCKPRRHLREKDIVSRIAIEFARQLAATRRFRTVLTRSTDEFVPPRARVARARSQCADLFLSIHLDALPNRQMRGISVFTLSAEASDKEAAAPAINENKADHLDGIDLARQPLAIGSILMDLARRQTSNSSLMLAGSIVEQLGRETRCPQPAAFRRFRGADRAGHPLSSSSSSAASQIHTKNACSSSGAISGSSREA